MISNSHSLASNPMITKKDNKSARMKAWREANPEKVKAYREKYRQKLRGEMAARLFFQMHSAVGSLQNIQEKIKERRSIQ